MMSRPHVNVVEGAMRIVDEARRRGIVLRLIGGLAVRIHCPSSTHRALARGYPDIDFMGLSRQCDVVEKLLIDMGYVPNERFNAINWERRLMFADPASGRRIDVMLDKFEMCHTLDLRNRLEMDRYTITLADLLLTKMQVFELTEKDVRDIITILKDHELGESDGNDEINVGYIARICSDDWGWYRTVTMNLERVEAILPTYELADEEREVVRRKIRLIRERMEVEPKSRRWKLRCLIGEKVRWWKPVEPPHPALTMPCRGGHKLNRSRLSCLSRISSCIAQTLSHP